MQAASQSTFSNAQFYTPLLIIGNDKNNQLARKPTLREPHFLRYKIIGALKKFKKLPRPLFSPKTNHTCHQKPNPSRETVPLNAGKI
jgi:hypothetical protein